MAKSGVTRGPSFESDPRNHADPPGHKGVAGAICDWELVRDVPYIGKLDLSMLSNRHGKEKSLPWTHSEIAFGPYAAVAFDSNAINHPEFASTGIVAVNSDDIILAAFGKTGASMGVYKSTGFVWQSLLEWSGIVASERLTAFQHVDDVPDGCYITLLPTGMPQGSVGAGAPAILTQLLGTQELWQYYEGVRRYRRTLGRSRHVK